VLELEAIDREALLAEDEAAKADSSAKPLRFASPVDMELTPADIGTWEQAPNGGRVWRLRSMPPTPPTSTSDSPLPAGRGCDPAHLERGL